MLVGFLAFSRLAAAEDATPAAADRPRPTKAEIDAWIAELDDHRYLVREEVTRKLLDAGHAALDALLVVANSERPEPADRALWILSRHATSADNDLAIAALEHLIDVRDRPVVMERAETMLAKRTLRACAERLEPLGAQISMQPEPVDIANIAPVLHVRLGPEWKGASADLRPLAQLRHQLHFRLEGAAVDDAAVKHFEEKEKLSRIELLYTVVTPAAIEALKKRHPDAMVYMRNDAKLGVGGENHAKGMLVLQVEENSAAHAAGILQGDIITAFDGQSVPDFDRLTVCIASHRPGDTVEVEVLRGEEQKKFTVTLKRWAEQR
jgi:hypothetical protein